VGESRLSEEHVLEVVRSLVNLGIDVNARDDEGDTAMYGAAAWGMNSVVQFLAEKGAKVNVTDKVGATPLLIAEGKFRIAAANTSHPETAVLLRKLGAEQ
jgi:ankyrin repeat protein